jgi:hypothetical protein
MQDKHTEMMAALEAALSAQSSKYATVSQQLRRELKEILAKASQVGRGLRGTPLCCPPPSPPATQAPGSMILLCLLSMFAAACQSFRNAVQMLHGH